MDEYDLICQPCAIEAGLVKISGPVNWYVGKELTHPSDKYSDFTINKPCIVCDAKQSKEHPLIEVKYVEVAIHD